MEQDGRLSKLQGKNGKNNKMFWQKKIILGTLRILEIRDENLIDSKIQKRIETEELKKNRRSLRKNSVKNGRTSSNTSKIIQKNKKSKFQSDKKKIYQGTKMKRKLCRSKP